MASLLIRKLDDGLKSQLRVRAASHGHSMEEEAREILKAGLSQKPSNCLNLAESIRKYIQPLGGVELQLPSREGVRRPPRLAR